MWGLLSSVSRELGREKEENREKEPAESGEVPV
jgi:hypothetical protein